MSEHVVLVDGGRTDSEAVVDDKDVSTTEVEVDPVSVVTDCEVEDWFVNGAPVVDDKTIVSTREDKVEATGGPDVVVPSGTTEVTSELPPRDVCSTEVTVETVVVFEADVVGNGGGMVDGPISDEIEVKISVEV